MRRFNAWRLMTSQHPCEWFCVAAVEIGSAVRYLSPGTARDRTGRQVWCLLNRSCFGPHATHTDLGESPYGEPHKQLGEL